MTTTTTTQVDDFKEPLASIPSRTTSTSTLYTLTKSTSFNPTRSLAVNSRGIGAFRLPIPSRETEIAIQNPDGSDAYISTRDKLWSGNCVLSHPKQGNLIRTDYFFGPNREPILRLLQTSSVLPDEVKVTGQWTSRRTRFAMPDGQEYEWVYAKEKTDGQRTNLLVLRAVNHNVKGEGKLEHRQIAQLVRGAETRTPGTSRCTAGNGGELQMDEGAMEGQLDAGVVVATCLMMLKKEVDRRRMIQLCVIGGAGGGS
ncbi:hypothetical protein N7509_001534 [Penicillium cosmopolitanum]|uniref:Uncharacterized protein n=1 Tax=Penicillium cosmopolitanum TaxID=1131564 RepID=A0A9W9W771_9EURO|nr:uncharacterized protein N7509_001534 [Penicillium cosmopolitanum]KAJ5407651.1 hypothetical protein N7509_001534 [Penicillium cosmopolitanum]